MRVCLYFLHGSWVAKADHHAHQFLRANNSDDYHDDDGDDHDDDEDDVDDDDDNHDDDDHNADDDDDVLEEEC